VTDPTPALDARSRGRSRLVLVLLFLAFLAPVLGAWLLHWAGAGPGTVVRGTLVEPPRPLGLPPLRLPDGAPLSADLLSGRWTLLFVGDGVCDAPCIEALLILRQVRLAVGEDMRRVQRLWLPDVAPGPEAMAGILAEHPGLLIGVSGGGAREDFVREFPAPAGGAGPPGRIYIVDPLGNAVVAYPAVGGEPKHILKDLQRLLKVSRIG
jgi:hypothetical protein